MDETRPPIQPVDNPLTLEAREAFETGIANIIGDYKTFFADLLERLLQKEINIAGKPISHICYRVETLEDFKILSEKLKHFSSSYAAHDVAKRPVTEFILSHPLDLGGGHTAEMIELLPNKEGRSYATGLENVGVLIGEDDFEEFTNQHKTKFAPDPKDRGADLQIPYITFESGKTVKFYKRPLKDIVISRGANFQLIKN